MPTQADYVAARLDHSRASWRSPRTAGVALLAIGIWMVLGAIDAALAGRPLVWDVAGSAISCAVILAVGFGLSPVIVGITSRRLYRQNKILHTEMTVGWSAEGISSASRRGEVRLGWSDLHAWRPGRRNFLFYYNDGLFWFLPYRILADEQVQEIGALADSAGLRRR